MAGEDGSGPDRAKISEKSAALGAGVLGAQALFAEAAPFRGGGLGAVSGEMAVVGVFVGELAK
jgi:hypothetical protein